VLISIFFVAAIWLAYSAQKRKHYSGTESMIDSQGETATDLDPEGQVLYQGEYWAAQSSRFISRGSKVRIVKVEGLKLSVEEIKKD
jgi:membrane-bound serine protease (ClpP class)